MVRRAFFPGAGFGTRMKELTKNLPKPLLKVYNIPLIYYSLFWGKYWGIKEAVVNVHYLGDKIREELRGFSEFKLNISEEKPDILGTGGGIRTGIHRYWNLKDDFLVINPDFLFFAAPSFSPWPNEEEKENFDCILFLAESDPTQSYTGLSLSEGKVSFEKGGYFYLGLSWMKASCLSSISPDKYYDLSDTFRELAAKGRLGGKVFPGTFLDLGEKEFYEAHRNTDFSNRLPKEWISFRDNIK
ncbi:sugar-phosphate nucleotidyltransferase [Leptospira wolffii]|uniref:sugar phosphate nucleotidyltransferase n=1 Tax=Leptospira wolffii TaxID=409998 RepID=UPI001084328C|nr:sugar phosphate nucleotidyltransferase [Leptospira wolffii]TGL49179.1 sugar-phosphate nucleotidyltransferase [Leptospira wolffii]